MKSERCILVSEKLQTLSALTQCWISHGVTYCPLDLPVFDELCKIADDELFGRAMRLSSHVLHALIPP